MILALNISANRKCLYIDEPIAIFKGEYEISQKLLIDSSDFKFLQKKFHTYPRTEGNGTGY